MRPIRTFEEELTALNTYYDHGSFIYESSSIPFTRVVQKHFSGLHRSDKYGVYIVRKLSTGEVLVIGKSGTINQDGKFKSQDIPKRLNNVKQGDKPANVWFGELLQENGQLIIDYIFVHQTTLSPHFVESLLLQAYLNDNGSLPPYNKSF